MGEQFVTVATFTLPAEAELARGRLEEEGIPAGVIGDMSSGLFVGFGNPLGGVQLQVPEAHAERALAILSACRGEDEAAGPDAGDAGPGEDLPPDAVQARPEQIVSGRARPRREASPQDEAGEAPDLGVWTCPQCQTRVGPDRVTCPSCGAATPSVQTLDDALSAPPRPAEMGDEEEDVSPEALQRRFTDDLARRAFRLAIIGVLLFGFVWFTAPLLLLILPLIVQLYSGYLLLRISLLPGEVSSYARWRILVAALIVVPTLVLAAWTARAIFGL
ncbi:MAG TPA: DUF2007 domain-containing protein [Gemmataceae bacterium]|nr:DUF2007 domain-containing protein [Gemmataceae bacterium]